MEQYGTFARGAATLETIRKMPDQPQGLKPGRSAKIRFGVGVLALAVGLFSIAGGILCSILANSAGGSWVLFWLILGGVAADLLGAFLVFSSLTPGTLNKIDRWFTAVPVALGLVLGALGALLAAGTILVILYLTAKDPNFLSTYPQLLNVVSGALVVSSLLAMLAVLDNKPILSISGRSGAASSVWRVWISSFTLAGALATGIILANRATSLSTLFPSALAITVSAALLKGAVSYRRRIDQLQREMAERLTNLVAACTRATSGGSHEDVAEALMQVENVAWAANEQGRFVSVERADTDIQRLIGYCIERLHPRDPRFETDPRFVFLQDQSVDEIVQVTASVADTLRWNLLAPKQHKLTSSKKSRGRAQPAMGRA